MEQTFAINQNSTIVLKAHGNLNIAAWDRAEVRVRGDQQTLKVERSGDTVRVVALSDCKIWLPSGARVKVEKADGNARAEGINGALKIERVGGNLTLRNMADVSVEKVGGELTARNLASLVAERVGGDCLVEQVTGHLKIKDVGGELNGQKIGSVEAERVGGDLILQAGSLHGSVRAGGDLSMAVEKIDQREVTISAGGDVELHLPEGAQLNLDILSELEMIEVDLTGTPVRIKNHSYFYPMGKDLPRLVIRAGGEVVVNNRPWEDLDFSTAFEDETDEPGGSSSDWEIPGMAAGMRAVERAVRQSERMAEKASRIGMDAARMAEERVQAAMRRMEMRFDGWDERPEPAAPVSHVQPVQGEAPAEAPVEESAPRQGVSEEERMLVLRMLQEKKITPEEAERLLEALESSRE